MDQAQDSFFGQLKRRRRRMVKKTGKTFIRSMSEFLGRQSLVPDTPVLDVAQFPFTRILEENWEVVRDEAQAILQHRESIPSFDQVSPDQKRISKGGSWRTFFLFGFGEQLAKNCAQAPETAKLLQQIPGIQTAWFSILAPGYHIPAHRGVTKGILTCHLGLIIPKEAERCRIRVEDQILVWRPGKTLMFCDGYDHEVWNDTEEERTVLLIQFDRPMKLPGRLFSKAFVALLKMTAFFKEPQKNMASFEDRFEAATKRANAALEKMSDGGEPPRT
ncbi:MAG: aspartyl/asparaginyl beta-hydroxylase domain-containing protein [Alphaproteobacteria bacterium]